MSNFRKLVSMSAIAMLGVTNVLTPLSYANAAVDYENYDAINLLGREAQRFSFNMPAHDVWLYAVTEANEYFVTYDGTTKTSWEMWTGTFTYDTTWHLESNKFKKTWYTFGWWKNDSGTVYEDQAEVWNWTTVENGVVPIHAQWIANRYQITYDLNDGSGTSTAVHPRTPTSWEYDEMLNIVNPTRTWYAFSGWTITNMDSGSHIVWWESSSATSAVGVMGTGFKNLRADGETVEFAARWNANTNTKYKVEHYLENLAGWYPGTPEETDNLSWTTDEIVTPSVHHFTWFTDATTYSTWIKADGSTVVKYEYPRKSYVLTLKAGTWVATVKWTGTQNTTWGSTSDSTTISFKYEEPVKLTFTLKDWYNTGAWTGYDTSSSFNMPATGITKIAYATPIVYQLTVNPRNGNGATASRTYTVEDEDIPLGTPSRDHSTFKWWTWWVNGVGINTPTKGVTVTWWSIGDREYSAVWSCITWYHLENTGADNEICNADTDTKYLVNHIQQDLSGNYTIYIETGYKYGVTNTNTAVTGRNDAWFELSGTLSSYNKNIEPDGSTIVNIYYKRLEYAWTVNSAVWVTSPSAQWQNSGTSPFKYEDTVELSATVQPGYTWSGWTVVDGSWNNIEVNDATSTDPNGATFVMPANTVTITPQVKIVTFDIDYELYWWREGVHNPTTYTVESWAFTLNDPKRDNSIFLWWTGWVINGEQLSGTTRTVEIPNWSVGNRKYYAVWSCEAWYHDVWGTSCVANNYNVEINLNYADSGHGTSTTTGFTYDTTWHIDNPEQSWYDFAWWKVTWISGGNATVDWEWLTEGETTSGKDFKNLTTENGGTVTLEAQWTPRTDTEYHVYHFYEDLVGGTYTQSWATELKTWTTASDITVASLVKNKSWFTYSAWYEQWGTTRPTTGAVTTVTIKKDGSTNVYLYYTRGSFTVHLSGDAHVDVLSWGGSYRYQQAVTVEATAKTWYHFVRWEERKANWGTGS